MVSVQLSCRNVAYRHAKSADVVHLHLHQNQQQ